MAKAKEKEIDAVVIYKETLPTIVNLDITEEALNELQHKYAMLPGDLSVEADYRFVQDGINTLRSLNPKVKARGKELKDDANAWIKKVTAEEKRILERIASILNPLVECKKEYDDKIEAEKEAKRKAEQMRKDSILAKINGIRLLLGKAQLLPSAGIEQVIAEVEAVVIDDSYDEFKQEAIGVRDDVEFALRDLLLKKQSAEEADRKRAEEDARLRREREQLARERAEIEAMRAQNERIQAEETKPAAAVQTKQIVSGEGLQQELDKYADARNGIAKVLGNHVTEATANSMASELLDAICMNMVPNIKYVVL